MFYLRSIDLLIINNKRKRKNYAHVGLPDRTLGWVTGTKVSPWQPHMGPRQVGSGQMACWVESPPQVVCFQKATTYKKWLQSNNVKKRVLFLLGFSAEIEEKESFMLQVSFLLIFDDFACFIFLFENAGFIKGIIKQNKIVLGCY